MSADCSCPTYFYAKIALKKFGLLILHCPFILFFDDHCFLAFLFDWGEDLRGLAVECTIITWLFKKV